MPFPIQVYKGQISEVSLILWNIAYLTINVKDWSFAISLWLDDFQILVRNNDKNLNCLQTMNWIILFDPLLAPLICLLCWLKILEMESCFPGFNRRLLTWATDCVYFNAENCYNVACEINIYEGSEDKTRRKHFLFYKIENSPKYFYRWFSSCRSRKRSLSERILK